MDHQPDTPLPPHLAQWKRSDWPLLVAAVTGLVLFIANFDQTSFAPRNKVSFNHEQLQHIAEEYAQKLGAPVGMDAHIIVQSAGFLQYESRAKWQGPHKAFELANNPVTYWKWRVEWENGTAVTVDSSGSLITFDRQLPEGQVNGVFSVEEIKPVAENALLKFFHRDISNLRLQTSEETWRGRNVATFKWIEPGDDRHVVRTYMIRIAGREVASLDSDFGLLPYTWERIERQTFPALALALILTILGFSQTQKLDLRARWRRWALALALLFGLWSGWLYFPLALPQASLKIIVCASLGVTCAVVFLFASATVEWWVNRVWPGKLSTFVCFFHDGVLSKPSGLAILRGTLIGFALLGADSFLTWVGIDRFGMRLDAVRHLSRPQGALLAMPYPSLGIFFEAIGHAVVIAGLVAFITSVISHFARRPWLTVVIAAVLVATIVPGPVITLAAVQPYLLKLLILAVECLILTCAFVRFDALTVGWAVFTFAFWWLNYTLFVMYEPTGALEQRIAFAAWGCFVLVPVTGWLVQPRGNSGRSK